jgi:hypothetical protein
LHYNNSENKTWELRLQFFFFLQVPESIVFSSKKRKCRIIIVAKVRKKETEQQQTSGRIKQELEGKKNHNGRELR